MCAVMRSATVLIVDGDPASRSIMRSQLIPVGYRALEAASGTETLTRLSEGVDAVLLDMDLRDIDSMELLSKIHEVEPDAVVIALAGHASIEAAVNAIKNGAYYYARKPTDVEAILGLIESGLENAHLHHQLNAMRSNHSVVPSLDSLIGESPAMRQAKSLLARIARSPGVTVLITGETGTGKDLAARILHYASARASGPFMNITCSALTETLLESELFGFERGAFTDAKRQKKGLLELANRGTVFLDEIAEMAPGLQAKLLRFLEEKTFRHVGGTSDICVDARIIAATNRDLADEVSAGRFRQDLFYRLNVLSLRMPSLREREGDVPLLVKHYVERFAREFNKPVTDVTKEALLQLMDCSWPGNVRSLRNVVERAVLLSEKTLLDAFDFPALVSPGLTERRFALPPEGVDLRELERNLLTQALTRCRGNQTRAAALLGLNREQVRYRMRKFGLVKVADAGSDTAPQAEQPHTAPIAQP
jgi:two-component system, NtrC family, response regulator AtoC